MNDPVRYQLNSFPPRHIDWKQLVPLIGQANASIARYDGLIAAIPNVNILLSPLTTQEAVLSSKIEGTNVTMGEVLELEAGAGDKLDQPKREDVEEIGNYRRALAFAAHAIDDNRPLSLHLLREAHSLLMNGVRGRDKDPGAFRKEQNWIGPKGCAITQANFIPIPQEHLLAGLDNLSAYLQNRKELDQLVQLALIHIEFEALHPFKDGNGRLGRMIIPLFLYERRVLSGPNFYMSSYLETRREQYVEAMRSVSRNGAWTEWCVFFLQGIIEQSSQNQAKAEAIIKLHARMQSEIPKLTHSQYSDLAVKFIFLYPIFATSTFVESSGIPRETAQRMLRALQNDGNTQVLSTIRSGSGRRPSVLAFTELLNIAEG